jgi:hypothetical protein
MNYQAADILVATGIPAIPVPDEPEHFTVGLLGVLMVMMVAVLIYVLRTLTAAQGAHSAASEANRAVNNTGPGEHRLYDRVMNIEQDFRHFRDSNNAEHEAIIRLIATKSHADRDD